MTIGRVVGRGAQAGVALAMVVVGLTWLNRVASSVMAIGGSCGSGGPYEVAHPCPGGAWMAPAGIFLGLAGLALYAFVRPSGSPSLVGLAWPALFGSLGYQFLRAAAEETDAWGFWLCGVLFIVMAATPLCILLSADRGALGRMLLGDGWAEPEPAGPADRFAPSTAPMVPVTFVAPETNGHEDVDLAGALDRLSKLHRSGYLSDAEFADAKHQVLGGG